MKRFAVIGVGGYIAGRHLRAIQDTGNHCIAALDKHDSVGIIDSYFPDAKFFTEFERFDRHLEKERHHFGHSVDYVTICSPNYLHDAHIRFALRLGANAICEKPLVLNPWNVDALMDLEKESLGAVRVILQLRLHKAIQAIKEKYQSEGFTQKHEIELTYIAPRGQWYHASWKGRPEQSGGLASNIGVHFFDMLSWLFGSAKRNEVNVSSPSKMAGVLELEHANVRWFLSVDRDDLPAAYNGEKPKTFRAIKIDGEEVEFSGGFADLHTDSYRDILGGGGFSMLDARPAIEMVSQIRNAAPLGITDDCHPILHSIDLN